MVRASVKMYGTTLWILIFAIERRRSENCTRILNLLFEYKHLKCQYVKKTVRAIVKINWTAFVDFDFCLRRTALRKWYSMTMT